MSCLLSYIQSKTERFRQQASCIIFVCLKLFKTGFEITTEIVHDSHDFHDKIFVVHDFVVHDFSAESTIFGAFF